MARNKNLQWDQYDPKYKKYLYIGKFFCSRDTNLLLGMSMTKHIAQWKVKNGHIDIHIIIGKKKFRI